MGASWFSEKRPAHKRSDSHAPAYARPRQGAEGSNPGSGAGDNVDEADFPDADRPPIGGWRRSEAPPAPEGSKALEDIRTWADACKLYGDDLRVCPIEAADKSWARSHAVTLVSESSGTVVLLYVQAVKGTVLLQQLRHKIAQFAQRPVPEHMIPATLLQAAYDADEGQPSRGAVASASNSQTIADTGFFELARKAVELNASDIHFRVRNDGSESAGQVLMRVDGELELVDTMPPERLVEIVASAYAKSDAKSVAEGQGQFNAHRPFSSFIRLGEQQKRIELRFQSNTERYGADAVMRVLNFDGKNAVSADLAASGYLPAQIEMFEEHGYGPGGSVLMIGETGSGKTTTLNCLLAGHPGVKSGRIYASTVEDPPEGRPAGVSQFPVARSAETGGKGGANPFVTALKALMRMDGDLICLGEIRDGATAEMWQELCLTGHKIYATTHAPSSIGAVERLCSSLMGLHPETVASEDVLSLGAYQKLVPKLCMHCRVLAKQSTFNTKKLHALEKLRIDADATYVRNMQGCENCRFGKKGAQVIVEMFNPKTTQRRMIARGQFSEAFHSWRETRGSTPFTSGEIQGKTTFEIAMNFAAAGVIGIDTVDNQVGRILTHEVIGVIQ